MDQEQTGPRYIKHELKIWPRFFDDVQSGEKSFDVRRTDRPFAVGNILILSEWDPETKNYTGRTMTKRIRFILDLGGVCGIAEGYAVLGLHNL